MQMENTTWLAAITTSCERHLLHICYAFCICVLCSPVVLLALLLLLLLLLLLQGLPQGRLLMYDPDTRETVVLAKVRNYVSLFHAFEPLK
jgi:hypothetical protein